MSATLLENVQEQAQKYWSPVFSKELRDNLLFGGLVNKDYEGEIKEGGNSVYVSQINAPEGQLLTIGANADSFSPETLTTSRVEIVADKRAVSAVEFSDLVSLQTQLNKENPEVINSLMYSVRKQMNDYLFSLVSTATTSQAVSGVTDFNASQLLAMRTLAAKNHWPKDNSWTALLDPQYHSDLLNAQTLTSADYVGDQPVVGGVIGQRRYGFNIFEDDTLPADYAIFFHPSFLHLVIQKEAQVKISDMHSSGKFGYMMSVDIIFGAKLGINADKKHFIVYNT